VRIVRIRDYELRVWFFGWRTILAWHDEDMPGWKSLWRRLRRRNFQLKAWTWNDKLW
jgi:hypothetical protein